ncbi:MAG: PH domain-containing protein [Patescibacteria group bacterium]
MMDITKLPNKRPNEHLLLILRRHWIELFRIVAILAVLLIIPAVAIEMYSQTYSLWLESPAFGPFLIVLKNIYLLGLWLFAFIEFSDYYLDSWVVSNERVLNIEQHGLFHRITSELHLAQVEDVTAETQGPIQTIFNFGNVQVQTAAERAMFQFKNIPNPERVKQKILELVHEDKNRHGLADTE